MKAPGRSIVPGPLRQARSTNGVPLRHHGGMVKVHFTSHLRHVAPSDPVEAAGATVADVLTDVFARHPAVRGYVLDDQDRIRLHIAVFVDGTHVRKDILAAPVTPASEVYVLQALSGG